MPGTIKTALGKQISKGMKERQFDLKNSILHMDDQLLGAEEKAKNDGIKINSLEERLNHQEHMMERDSIEAKKMIDELSSAKTMDTSSKEDAKRNEDILRKKIARIRASTIERSVRAKKGIKSS